MPNIIKGSSRNLSVCSTSDEILEWLMDECSRVEVIAIAVWIANHSTYSAPTSGTLDQIVYGLRKVKGKVLLEAIGAILGEDDEDETSEDSEDEDSEDDSEDEDDDAEDEDSKED